MINESANARTDAFTNWIFKCKICTYNFDLFDINEVHEMSEFEDAVTFNFICCNMTFTIFIGKMPYTVYKYEKVFIWFSLASLRNWKILYQKTIFKLKSFKMVRYFVKERSFAWNYIKTIYIFNLFETIHLSIHQHWYWTSVNWLARFFSVWNTTSTNILTNRIQNERQ